MVPNAPCGVESPSIQLSQLVSLGFLMHRVELKAKPRTTDAASRLGFLMHRVELKALIVERVETTEDLLVPNAPCGVESRFLSSSSLLLLSFLMHRVELKV